MRRTFQELRNQRYHRHTWADTLPLAILCLSYTSVEKSHVNWCKCGRFPLGFSNKEKKTQPPSGLKLLTKASPHI